MTLQKYPSPKSLIIYIDTQSAIWAIRQQKNKSDQHIHHQIVQSTDILR